MNRIPRRWLPTALFGLLAVLGAAAVAVAFGLQGGTHQPRPATADVAAPSAGPVASSAPGRPSTATVTGLPLFAYYYIWFDPSSWDRAKIDHPRLGDYSSDDPNVMRKHIEWAKSAGIQGFIVSWKDTATNDRRLKLLMQIAQQEDFKLAMIYQGLDFSRNPLPASTVAADFKTFHDQYAPDPVFYRLGGKTLTIWSGTWDFSHTAVAQATAPVRDTMLVLSTEKSVSGYKRIADVTDGDAYYWSSVNPETNNDYGAKLNAMATAIHKARQFWIAPFAPGFDARLVGGSGVIDRNGGQTLRTEYAAALSSSPDVLGLISWNEFSENSYIEPSKNYGTLYLDTLRDLRGASVPTGRLATDSSSTGPAADNYRPNMFKLGGFAAVLLGATGALVTTRRSRATERGAAATNTRDMPVLSSIRHPD